MEAAWRQGITRRRQPRKRILDCAVHAQRNSAISKRDRLTRVGCRVLGAMGKERGAFQNTILTP
jgi:hypothetical protein